jgi:hypothetical protein
MTSVGNSNSTVELKIEQREVASIEQKGSSHSVHTIVKMYFVSSTSNSIDAFVDKALSGTCQTEEAGR